MTSNTTLPILLDGKVVDEGARARGQNMKNELLEFLRIHFKYYVLYVTDDDLILLWDDEHQYTEWFGWTKFRVDANNPQSQYEQYCEHTKRMRIVMDKIPQDYILQKMNADFKIKQALANRERRGGVVLGPREFTLTYSPKWCTDAEARDLMKKAMNKLSKYYDGEILQLRAIGEVGSNGLSHLHVFYSLRDGVKITDKNFKRAYEFWNPKKKLGKNGFEGGHHANVREVSDFLGYIEKDIDKETCWYQLQLPAPQDI